LYKKYLEITISKINGPKTNIKKDKRRIMERY